MMRSPRRCWRAAVAVACVLASSQALEAQSPPPPILPSTRVVQLGPASLYPSIALRDVGTDSNVYNDGLDPRADFTYSVAPRLFTVIPIANARFIGTGTGDFVYYRTYKDQQSLNGFVEGRYDVVEALIRPFAVVGFATQERQTLEIDARVRQSHTTITLGAEVALTAKTALTGWVQRAKAVWDEDEHYFGSDLSEELDSTTDIAAAGARFRLTPFTSIVAIAEIQRDRFESSPQRDADSLRLAPYVEFDSGASIVGRARAGFRTFRPLQFQTAGYSGPVSSVALAWNILNTTRGKVDAGHDVRFSYDPMQPFYLETGLTFEIRQRVAGPFDVVGLGERWQLRHQRAGASSFDGRSEDITMLGAGIGVRMREQVELTFTIERRERTSSDPLLRNYERRRVLASISYGLS